MLAIIATKRLTEEIRNYEPNVIAIEQEVYKQGPKIISSALQNILREQGMSDAYDAIKGIVMKPFVRPEEVSSFIDGCISSGKVEPATGKDMEGLLQSVMETHDYVGKLATGTTEVQLEMVGLLNKYNRNETRKRLIGNAVQNTGKMAAEIAETRQKLQPYFN